MPSTVKLALLNLVSPAAHLVDLAVMVPFDATQISSVEEVVNVFGGAALAVDASKIIEAAEVAKRFMGCSPKCKVFGGIPY